MTLATSFIWKNPDSTRDLNRRLEKIVNRGVVYGGSVTPGVGLNVLVDPSVAISFDGMTVVEDAQQTLPVVANQQNYIVLWAKYNAGGSPATPTVLWQVFEQSVYNAHPEKDYMIVYAMIDLPPAVVSVTLNDIYFTVKDEVNPLARDWYRGSIATPATLPVPPPHGNRIGDFFFVQSDHTFHFWNGTIWEPLNTGSYNAETTFMNYMLTEGQRNRNIEGSGILAGPRPNVQGDFSSDTEVSIIETPTIADQIGFDSFSAYVNGHYVELHGQHVAMAVKPGIGIRYDMIFLEVWREYLDPSVAVPENVLYDRNPDGTLTYTISEVGEKVEKLEWKQGITIAPTADNFNLNAIEPDDHGWNVIKFRLVTIANLPATTALYNPSDPTVSALGTNIDGNPFTSQPAGSGSDDRLWSAPAITTSVDDISWAIPLFVVKRTAAEVSPNAIRVFRDGERFVFPVYPVTDVSHTAKKVVDNVYRNEPTPFGIDHYPFEESSGFLGGMEMQVETKTGTGTLAVYEDSAHVRIRGVEDNIKLAVGSDIAIPAAPSSGWNRMLVYLKMNVTLYDNGPGTATTLQYISNKHRPYLPSNVSGDIRGQGWKRGYVTFEYVVEHLGATDTYLDENEVMVASGWTRGDLSMSSANAQYEDGGIWSKAIAIDFDDRIHPYEMEWAIPVCLAHRRNNTAWAFDTNPNGSTNRPDGHTDANWIYQDDLVDLRHEVDVDEYHLALRLSKDIDQLMTGQLRTRLANKHLGAGGSGEVAGTRILQTDALGIVAGASLLSPPDGVRKIWSDAREFYPVAASFDLMANSSGALYDYTYDALGKMGTLIIRSPGAPGAPYAQIVRHLPALLYVDQTAGSPTLRDFLGPPCWSTQEGKPATNDGIPMPATAKWVDTSTPIQPQEHNLPFYYFPDPTQPYTGGQGFEVTTKDAIGRAIEMTGKVDLNGITSGNAVLSWWVHFDRSLSAPLSANYGLSGIPDVVHQVIKDPGGANEEVNVGPLYTTVRTQITAGTTWTITAADVAAASGISGTVTLVGIAFRAISSSNPLVLLHSSVVMNDARDTITGTVFGGPFTESLDVPVFFKTSDVDKWVEIGRGGKSVQAYFEWEELSVNFGVPAPAGQHSYDIGSDTWRNLSLGGKICANAPIYWTRAGLSGDWTMAEHLFGAAPRGAYEHSNLVSFIADGFDMYALIIVPAHKALTAAASDNMVIHYTYTPYQGLSSDGEKKATIGTALPKCKELLHGDIKANSDFHVTQSGACSYFSGVDSWTGYPPTHGIYNQMGSMGCGRFAEYNETVLVQEPKGRGTIDLTNTVHGNKSMNAAAIMRLPFPELTTLYAGAYHTGIMAFDFDPGRVGASAGFRSYAPGYEPAVIVNYDQFVGGTTPLATHGSPHAQDRGAVMGPSSYAVRSNNDGILEDDAWRTNGVGTDLELYIDPQIKGSELVKRLSVKLKLEAFLTNSSRMILYANDGSYEDYTNIPATYLRLNTDDARWTSYLDIPNEGSIKNYNFVVNPGTLMEYYLTNDTSKDRLNPILRLSYREPVASTGYSRAYGSYAIVETEETYNKHLGTLSEWHAGKLVDLVILPFGSGSQQNSSSLAFYFDGHETSSSISTTSLKGKRIEYPAWSPATTSVLESFILPTSDIRGAGRGLCLSDNTNFRFNFTTLVPGTGTTLSDILRYTHTLVDTNEVTPERYPYMPSQSLFASTNQVYCTFDHGGPIAYVCLGILINPSSDTYKNRAVMQISGGPTGGIGVGSNTYGVPRSYTAEDLDGTALDAFWPKGRPLLKSKK